jgi:ribosomal protein S18 acetylase RimI-like enzyme
VSTIEIVRHASAAELLAAAEPWLLRSEAENNVILGIARRHRDAGTGGDMYWASVCRGDEVVGCAMRTPPYPAAITAMPPEGIERAVADLRRIYPSLPALNGPEDAAERFASLWCATTGTAWRVRMRLRVHALRAVNDIEGAVAGELRPARLSEQGLMRQWVVAFAQETDALGANDSTEAADRMLRAGHLFLWDDAGPRSLVACGRDTPNGGVVSTVYTPPPYRRRGYATAAVAALSRLLLAAGKAFCCLYTDVSNPTSNAIYRRIGYVPLREDAQIEFTARVDA